MTWAGSRLWTSITTDTGETLNIDTYKHGAGTDKYGNRNDIQRAGVQYIIDSIIQALLADKVIICEQRF